MEFCFWQSVWKWIYWLFSFRIFFPPPKQVSFSAFYREKPSSVKVKSPQHPFGSVIGEVGSEMQWVFEVLWAEVLSAGAGWVGESQLVGFLGGVVCGRGMWSLPRAHAAEGLLPAGSPLYLVPWTLPVVLVPTCLVEEKQRLSAEVLGRFPISIGLWFPLRPHVAHLENRTSQWYPTAPSVPVRSPYILVMRRALPMLAATVASVRPTGDADVKGQQSQTG